MYIYTHRYSTLYTCTIAPDSTLGTGKILRKRNSKVQVLPLSGSRLLGYRVRDKKVMGAASDEGPGGQYRAPWEHRGQARESPCPGREPGKVASKQQEQKQGTGGCRAWGRREAYCRRGSLFEAQRQETQCCGETWRYPASFSTYRSF